MYNNLLFFDKNGSPLNFIQDADGIWRGNLHFAEVGIKLVENETIYVVQEFQDAESQVFNLIYGMPHIDPSMADNSIGSLSMEFGVSPITAYKFFTIDHPYNKNPQISFSDRLSVRLPNNSADAIDVTTGRVITPNNTTTAARFDISISSPDQGVYEKTIILKDVNDVVVAVINLYGEIVGEDERLNTLLANFGESIYEREEYIFRESDINEDLPNYQVLNQKRKELLIEFHNIIPYLASYKGILNILKFFGYYDVTLKEYYFDVSNGKYRMNPVVIDDYTRLDQKIQSFDYPWTKTIYFGLFYNINEEIKDQYDDFGLPITQDSFIFSNEEILIKLFGLKQYIKDRSIGGVAQILDIVGEYSLYDRYSTKTWNDKATIDVVDTDVTPSFELTENIGYISDLRPILNDFANCSLNRVFIPSNYPGVIPSQHKNCFVGWFWPMLQDEPEPIDQPNIPVGYLVQAKNTSFNLPWKSADTSWRDTGNCNLVITWGNVTHVNFYDVEWVIKRSNTNSDGRKYTFSVRGKTQDMANFSTILPYDGYYDIAIILHGWNGSKSVHTEKNALEVRMYEPDFINYFRYFNKYLQKWKTNYLTWREVNTNWGHPIFDNNRFVMSQMGITTRTINIVNYINTDKIGDKQIGVKSPTWDQFPNNTWADYQWLNWRQLKHDREQLSRFLITKLKAKGKLQVGKDTITFPDDLNVQEYERAAGILSASVGEDISAFEYTARGTFIDCVAKSYGEQEDRLVGCCDGVEIKPGNSVKATKVSWRDYKDRWKNVPTEWNKSNSVKTQARSNPFTMSDICVYHTRFDVPIMVPVFMTVDNCKIPGKTNVRWVITSEYGEVMLDEVSMTMVYRFIKSGVYTVSVTIIDSNGNQKTIVKTNHIRVLDAAEFNNNLLFDNVYTTDRFINVPKSELIIVNI